jgi:ferrochelatase
MAADAANVAGPVGVLVMAYGTPASPDGIEAYYTDIRRGRPPSPEQLDDLRSRYEAIGGVSPLLARTQAQVAGVQAALGDGFVCALGQKHAAPFIEDAAASLVGRGVRSIVGLVLAPHYSALSVGEYHQRAAAAGGVRYAGVESWHLEPGLVGLLADRVSVALAEFAYGERVVTLVTAHSLPARVLDMGDPYPKQLQETAEAVMAAAGVPAAGWRLAWQSAGRTPEPWLGPDLLEVIAQVADDGVQGVVVCPAGFTSDHLEVLYDVDVQARAAAESRGVRLVRTESLNADPRLCAVLADVVRRSVT